MSRSDRLSRRKFLGRSALGAVAAGLADTATAGPAAPAVDNPWRYDVEQLRRVDPKLLGYTREGGFPVEHPASRRVVYGPDGRLFIAAGPSVLVFSREGQRVGAVRVGDQVRCLRVAPDGRLWVGLRDHVRVVTVEGEEIARWPAFSGSPFLTGLALGGEDVFVADSGNRVVYRCDRQGRVQLRLGEKNPDRAIPGLILPSPFLDVEVGEDGLVRVNNPGRHKVEVYTREGDLELSWGRPGVAIDSFCGCCNPVGIALLPDGAVVTAEKGLPRVKVFRAAGEMETVVAGPDDFAPVTSEARASIPTDTGHDGLDVAVDGSGRVAVLDRVGGAVHFYRKGTLSG